VNCTRILIIAGFVVTACSSATDTNRDPSVTPMSPALGVEMFAALAGTSALGDSARVVIRNTSGATRYLSRCGSGPLILVAPFVNGAWGDGVQDFACLASTPPGPVQLASGDSVFVGWWLLPPGSYRFVAFASTSPELTSQVRTTSNSVHADSPGR
jgi:hypothetical protein